MQSLYNLIKSAIRKKIEMLRYDVLYRTHQPLDGLEAARLITLTMRRNTRCLLGNVVVIKNSFIQF